MFPELRAYVAKKSKNKGGGFFDKFVLMLIKKSNKPDSWGDVRISSSFWFIYNVFLCEEKKTKPVKGLEIHSLIKPKPVKGVNQEIRKSATTDLEMIQNVKIFFFCARRVRVVGKETGYGVWCKGWWMLLGGLVRLEYDIKESFLFFRGGRKRAWEIGREPGMTFWIRVVATIQRQKDIDREKRNPLKTSKKEKKNRKRKTSKFEWYSSRDNFQLQENVQQ